MPDQWKTVTDFVTERLRRELEEDPSNVELAQEVKMWLDGMQDTLDPQSNRATEVLESVKGWNGGEYLPAGLTGEMPATEVEMQVGLRLLKWYISEDYQRKKKMEPEDATILTRWAFTKGVLHVEVVGAEKRMQIKETYAALMKIVEQKGEGAGKQIRRN